MQNINIENIFGEFSFYLWSINVCTKILNEDNNFVDLSHSLPSISIYDIEY